MTNPPIDPATRQKPETEAENATEVNAKVDVTDTKVDVTDAKVGVTDTETDASDAKKTKPKRSRVKKILLILLIILLVLALAAGGTVAWMYRQGQKDLLPPEPPVITPPETLVDSNDGDRVVYNGVAYEYNQNVTAILVVGVDKKDIQEQSVYGQNGQADTLFLATLDTKTGDIHLIPLSRETMVDVDQYAVDGTYMGVEKTQLCLAYAYAANGEEGCENVVRSVSRLLYGVPINSYVAIDMDGVQVLTDTIGGVTVTALESVPHPRKGYNITEKGKKVTLDGQNALTYLRHRDSDPEANTRRMSRFRQFFSAFITKAGGNLKKDISLLPRYYNTASPYLITDITLSKMTYLVGCALSGSNWKDPAYHAIKGEAVAGEEHNEFYADTASAYEAVLAAFYTPVSTPTDTGSTAETAGTTGTTATAE